MQISPILNYYSAQNIADIIQDYKNIKEKISQSKNENIERPSILVMNTKRDISDLSEHIKLKRRD